MSEKSARLRELIVLMCSDPQMVIPDVAAAAESEALEILNEIEKFLKELDETFRLIAETCGEDGVSPPDWAAMTFPTHAEFALRAVRELRNDYWDVLSEV